MTEAPEKIEVRRWTKQCKKHKGEWWVEVVVVDVVNVAVVGCCWLLLAVYQPTKVALFVVSERVLFDNISDV